MNIEIEQVNIELEVKSEIKETESNKKDRFRL